MKFECPAAATVGFAAAVAAAVALGSTASAGMVSPQLSVAVAVSGDAPQSSTSTSGFRTASGSYLYDGSIASSSGSSWFVNWNLTGSDTVAQPGSPSITNNFAVGNTGDVARVFQILVTYAAPVQVDPGTGYAWQTTLSGVLVSNNGGVASLVGLMPAMIQGQINGTGVVQNNPPVASTTTASFFEPSVNTYAGPIPDGPNIATIGYLMTFSLSAHSTAVFNGSWAGAVTTVPVPAPGAAALLAVAGMAARGRRRG